MMIKYEKIIQFDELHQFRFHKHITFIVKFATVV